MNAEKLYRESEEMIKKMSGRISTLTGIEKEEIICQGNLIFCQCLERFEEAHGEFSKYLSNALHFGLYKYAKKESELLDHFDVYAGDIRGREKGSNSDITRQIEKKLSVQIDYSAVIDATFQNLSRDAEYIRTLIFSAETKMPARKYKSTRVTKRKLTEYLRSEGWKIPRIQRAFTEISESLGV